MENLFTKMYPVTGTHATRILPNEDFSVKINMYVPETAPKDGRKVCLYLRKTQLQKNVEPVMAFFNQASDCWFEIDLDTDVQKRLEFTEERVIVGWNPVGGA